MFHCVFQDWIQCFMFIVSAVGVILNGVQLSKKSDINIVVISNEVEELKDKLQQYEKQIEILQKTIYDVAKQSTQSQKIEVFGPFSITPTQTEVIYIPKEFQLLKTEEDTKFKIDKKSRLLITGNGHSYAVGCSMAISFFVNDQLIGPGVYYRESAQSFLPISLTQFVQIDQPSQVSITAKATVQQVNSGYSAWIHSFEFSVLIIQI